jgi:hypothetical protein
MRLRSLVAMAATSVLSLHAHAEWPSHDVNQDGVIDFVDLSAAIGSGDFVAINQVLTQWGELVAPAVVGDPGAPGADAKAIARWNAIPGQFINGNFKVGVVAYHMNEIAEVRFFLDGAPLGIVTNRSTNPSTGNPEFWITVPSNNFADGSTVTLSAIVLPTGGVPRILQGEFNAASAGKGEHSLPLVVRRSAPPTVYVGYDGNDLNPGTREQPLLTISKAIRVVPDGGEVVLLNAGGYEMPQNGFGHLRRDNTDWITIRPDFGLQENAVGITGETRNLFRANMRRLRLQGLTIDFAKVTQVYSTGEQMTWIDGCTMIDSEGWTIENRPISVRNPWFATDALAENKLYAYSGASLVRNSVARQISGDVFQNNGLVVGCIVNALDGTVLTHHTDLVQVFGARDNLIVADVVATGLRSAQSFFLEPSFEGGPDESERWLTNSAFVNIAVDIAPVFQWNANENMLMNWGGAPWSQLLSRFEHVVFDNVELANQRIMIRSEVQGVQAFAAHNVIFRNVGLHPITYSTYHNNSGAAVPPGVQFIDCYPHPDAATAP